MNQLGPKKMERIIRTPGIPVSRSFATVKAHLILKRDNQVLFQLRQNWGYNDGKWSLLTREMMDNESATYGVIRDAHEKLGIDISPTDLNVVHVVLRRNGRLNTGIFFGCSKWLGDIENRDTEMCEKLEFFSLQQLPSNIVESDLTCLKAISEGKFYSEEGSFIRY